MKRATAQDAHYKQQYRAVAIAVQADARDYDGGVPALADQIGANYGSLKNRLTPTNYDSELTVRQLLDVIDATGGRRTNVAISRLGGMTSIPMCDICHGEPADIGRAFLEVVKRAGEVSSRTVEALADGDLSFSESEDVGNLLDEMIGSAVQMRALVRGR